MIYKIYLKAMICDRWVSKFMKNCDLGITEVGSPCTISFTMEKKPTKNDIKKIIESHSKSKEEKEQAYYFKDVKLDKIELLEEN